MKDLVLYTITPSRGSAVLWMLEECGADYDTVVLSYDSVQSADYLAVNPMGKVPALKHKGEVLTETAAILSYLAEQFPDKKLIPAAGSEARGQYYRWLFFLIHLEYAGVDKMRGLENDANLRRAIGYGDFDTAVHTLRDHLNGRDHMVGHHFTALDLYCTGLLDWMLNGTGVLPADPVFTRYIALHRARPAAVC